MTFETVNEAVKYLNTQATHSAALLPLALRCDRRVCF